MCEALEHFFKTKETENAEILRKTRDITDEQKRTQENISDAVRQLMTYQQDNTQLIQRIEDLEKKVKSQNKNLDTLTKKLDERDKDAISIWKKINEESASIQATHNTLAANVSTIGSTKETLESNTKTLTKLSERFQAIETSVAALEMKANEKINDISSTLDVLEKLQTQLDETTTKATYTADYMKNLGDTIANNTGCLSSNTTALENIMKSLILVKREITDQLSTASNINLSTNQKSEQIIESLSKITTSLCRNLESLNTLSGSIASCVQDVRKLEEESGDKIRSSVTGLEELERNMTSLTTSIEICGNNVQKLEQESGENIKSGVTALDGLHQNFQSLMASIQTCVDNMRKIEKTTISNINSRTKEWDQLNENVRSTSKILEEVQEKVENNTSNLTKCFDNLEGITKNLSSNEGRLTTAESDIINHLTETSADLTKSTTAIEGIKETINTYSRTMEDSNIALHTLNTQMENELKTICEESTKVRLDLGIKRIDQGKLIWHFIGEKFETGYEKTCKEISGVSELIKTLMNSKKFQQTVDGGEIRVTEVPQGVAQNAALESGDGEEVGQGLPSEISDKRPRSNGDDTETPGSAKRRCNNERQSSDIEARWISIFIDGPAGLKQKKSKSLASSQIPTGIQDLIHDRRTKIRTRPDNVDFNKDRPRFCFMSQYYPSCEWPESINMPRGKSKEDRDALIRWWEDKWVNQETTMCPRCLWKEKEGKEHGATCFYFTDVKNVMIFEKGD